MHYLCLSNESRHERPYRDILHDLFLAISRILQDPSSQLLPVKFSHYEQHILLVVLHLAFGPFYPVLIDVILNRV